MKQKKYHLKIAIYGYDVATTELATHMVIKKISQLKLNFGLVSLPTKEKKITVLVSPHKHKKAQKKIEQETHKKAIFIADISSTDLEDLFPIRNFCRLVAKVLLVTRLACPERERLFPTNGNKLRLEKLLQKKEEKKLSEKERSLNLANSKLVASIEKLKSLERKLEQEEKRINSRADQLLRKEELFIQQLSLVSQKEKKVHSEMEKMEKMEERLINELGKIIPMNSEEAKKNLFALLREKVDQDLEKYKEQKFRKITEEVKEEGNKLICSALENCSSELVFPRTTNTLQVENRQIISKIIGREGRNINAFRRITGTEVIIDKESDDLTIQISSFNSLRREIAYQTLISLIKEKKFSPEQIEKTYHQMSSRIDELITENGKKALRELEITGVHPELIKHLGKLKYRTSYGQNVLQHCLEVAKLTGNIAAELGLDVILARRVGLFHDIGKSIEDNGGYSHVINGVNLAKKYKEPGAVINAIASHHHDFPADNFYSLIILATDRLSAARPGARGYQLEAYIERMGELEKIASQFPGIKKIIADAEKLNDYQTWEISRKIKERIKESVVIPGEVTIYVVREKKFIQKLNDGKIRENTYPELIGQTISRESRQISGQKLNQRKKKKVKKKTKG
ncbi:6827_t:CDS:2 [Funneliformis geosporum]|uniref:6827_t:CDS:1 n=1 Tax=Funneliformis geosporum TaxID=1117311 RepID=A0A9W4SCY9_9GLOM|nr:6827_t:CDS:2 [Funneliformis geosporum]